jgi:hypothetical protein
MTRKKKHTPEQVLNLLRQIEVAVAQGKTTALACKEAEITEQVTAAGARSTAGFRWIRRGG